MRTTSCARVLVVSESGILRAPLALACLREALDDVGVTADVLSVEARASMDYCLGQSMCESGVAASELEDAEIDPFHTAMLFEAERDAAETDVILCVDTGSASDVLKAVCCIDIVNKDRGDDLSKRVRRLGEFEAGNADADIEDALYGNAGGDEEIERARAALRHTKRCCEGFAKFVAGVAGTMDSAAQPPITLSVALREAVGSLRETPWLVPPMLQSKQPLSDVSKRDSSALPTDAPERRGGGEIDFDFASLE